MGITDLSHITPQSLIDPAMATEVETAEAIAAHEGAINPHPIYLNEAEGDARYRQKNTDTFKAAANVPQNIPAATFTKITMDVVTTNSNNQYNSTLSRLTAITQEEWNLTVYVTFNLSVAGRVMMSIFKNGAESIRLYDIAVNAGRCVIRVKEDILLNTNDYLEVFAYLGAAASTTGNADLNSVLWSGRKQ